MGITIAILLILTIFGWMGSVLWERIRKNANRTSSTEANNEVEQSMPADALQDEYRTQYDNAETLLSNRHARKKKKQKNKIATADLSTESDLLNINKLQSNQNQYPTNPSCKNLAEELNLSDVDNARKAFIASELFDRKY